MEHTSEQKAREFWDWFSANNASYLFIQQVEGEERDRLLNIFIEELHKYHPNLFFEIGGPPNAEKVELIITAEGIREYFGAVELLVSLAGQYKDWEIIAFKPPMGTHFKVEIGGHEFEPENTIFIPLVNEEAPGSVGISVCYADYDEEERNAFLSGTFLMLDVVLGEKAVATEVDYIEIIRTPDNIAAYPFRHISDLREYIDEVKQAN